MRHDPYKKGYIPRDITSEVRELSEKIPVLVVTGPRQSGKTTAVREIFKGYNYFNLEYPDTRLYAEEDPRGFLETNADPGIIIDEIQNLPQMLSYIQGFVDESNVNGRIILTGSRNFNLLEGISQSLAGRTIVFSLLPLSIAELKQEGIVTKETRYEELILQGFYPRLYKEGLKSSEWMPSYISNHVQRDIRQLINIKELNSFHTFLKMCAGRIGQLINYSSIANDIGVDHRTVSQWISLLETSYVVFRLRPYYRNWRKRLVKSPKLYFYDTGLACSILGITEPEQVASHFLKGGLFENMVISEMMKNDFNRLKNGDFYFFRDHNGNELDLIKESRQGELLVYEIKSGRTVTSDYFKGLKYFRRLTEGDLNVKETVVYGGRENRKQSGADVVSWFDAV